jgi:DNA-binding IclR family transcriptional regulator
MTIESPEKLGAERPGAERPGEATGGIQSLDAALWVLTTMARLDGAVGLSELARACDMPASKTHRYLASFINSGLVRQNGRSGTYDLGPGAIEIGLAAINRHDFVNSVADRFGELTEETGLTGLLCVWGNSGPTVVRWIRAANFIVTSLGLGSTLPLLSSATGRVFFAWLPETITEKLMHEELKRARASGREIGDAGPGGIVAGVKGARTLTAKVREDGYATVDGRFIPGLVAASAPILDWQDEAQAVVTLIGTNPKDIEPGSPAIAALTQFCAEHSVPKRG